MQTRSFLYAAMTALVLANPASAALKHHSAKNGTVISTCKKEAGHDQAKLKACLAAHKHAKLRK